MDDKATAVRRLEQGERVKTDLERYATPEERRLATALVDVALAKGYRLSVYDGEEVTVRKSADRAEVLGALASTDHDWLRIWNGGVKLGAVLMIWGNGSDLFSDWTGTAAMNALVEPIAFGQID